MKKLLLLVFCSVCLPSLLYSQDNIIKNPLADYISIKEFPDFLKPVTNATVVVLPIVLINEKTPTIFISYSNFSNRDGMIWTAYTPCNLGYQRIMQLLDGNLIQFRCNNKNSCYSTKLLPGYTNAGGLFVSYRGRDGANISYYNIKNGMASVIENIKECDYTNTNDMTFLNSLFDENQKKTMDHFSKTLTINNIKKSNDTNWVELLPKMVDFQK